MHHGTQYQHSHLDTSYWLQEHLQINTFPYHQDDSSTATNSYYEDGNTGANVGPQQYDFLPLGGELFQPEEIFQLDQPLKSQDYAPMLHDHNQNSDIASSPPMLLDLGSGIIHRSPVKPEPESAYWMLPPSIITTDESNSSSSRFPTCSPDTSTNIVTNPMEDMNRGIGFMSQCDPILSLQCGTPQDEAMKIQCATASKETVGLLPYGMENDRLKMQVPPDESQSRMLYYSAVNESRSNAISSYQYHDSYKLHNAQSLNETAGCDSKNESNYRFNCIESETVLDTRLNIKESNFSIQCHNETETPMSDIHYQYPVVGTYCGDASMSMNSAETAMRMQDPLGEFRLQCGDEGYHSITQFPHFQH
jgi:hypothetical protein